MVTFTGGAGGLGGGGGVRTCADAAIVTADNNTAVINMLIFFIVINFYIKPANSINVLLRFEVDMVNRNDLLTNVPACYNRIWNLDK